MCAPVPRAAITSAIVFLNRMMKTWQLKMNRWGSTNLDVLAAQKKVQDMTLPAYPLEIPKPASMAELDAQEAYFRENKEQILADLSKHGAVVVRGFDLCKTPGIHLPSHQRFLEIVCCRSFT